MGTAHATRYLACMVLGIACATAAVHPPVAKRVAAAATRFEPATPLRHWLPPVPARTAAHCTYS